MHADELRDKYLRFFASQGHKVCASDVLVPTWDPSVLFTPAGMNPFKDHFLGKVKLEFTRATSCQRCLRTGDIENVGRTAYHHTFFEMLGNFSFGDYFKREAIRWAWQFCTEPKWLGLDQARLSVTVYVDDDEAAGIWSDDIGLPSQRIERMGEDDNFWPAGAPSQGPDGVCGPCSEIFYHDDKGGSVEIWNLVFTQFNRVGEPPDNLRPLPSKNIDTGMGLERTAAVLQNVSTNYHIDILRPIVEAAAEITGRRYEPGSEEGRRLRRITDHIRACTFAIHENVYPGPQKEKYVVRRLLRRAVLDGHQLGQQEPFLFQLVPKVVQMMQAAYPELRETADRVAGVVRQEEQSFFATIDNGLARLDKIFADLKAHQRVVVDGHEAAELYVTYGLPPELVESMAAEQNLTFDRDGFRDAMQQHGRDSGAGQFELFKTGPIEALKKALHETRFLGYEGEQTDAEIKGIVAQNQLCDRVDEVGHEQPIVVVLDQSPFYGEAGGQVGDTGLLQAEGLRYRVVDTQKDGGLILHYGHLEQGCLHAGQTVRATVDRSRRQGIRRAHSATHLLHHALQQQLGKHAQQQGSKVDDDWLRFDFTNLAALDDDQVRRIELDVREHIGRAAGIRAEILPLAEARAAGAMMLFGEKYPDPVRMVSMGQFSRELCGGTHLTNTSEVEQFEILAEEGVAAGTRRIVALTGEKARQHAAQVETALNEAASLLGVAPGQVPAAAEQLARSSRELKKQLATGSSTNAASSKTSTPAPTDTDAEQRRAALKETARILNVAPFDVPDRLRAMQHEIQQLQQQVQRLADSGTLDADSLLETAESLGNARLVIAESPGATTNLMRQLIDQLRKKASPIAVLLAAAEGDDKVVIVAGLSHELVERGGHAGNWVREVAKELGGGGGGKPDMAQAGGKEPQRLAEGLAKARQVIQSMLS